MLPQAPRSLPEQTGSVLCPKVRTRPDPARAGRQGAEHSLGKGAGRLLHSFQAVLVKGRIKFRTFARPKVVKWHKERGRTWGRGTVNLRFSR